MDRTVLELVKLRTSILNGCAYCVDMHSRDALAAGEQSRRLFAVAAWREAPFFDERERAALALTDAVTRLGEHGVSDEVWDTAVKHWSEDGVVNLVLAIGTIAPSGPGGRPTSGSGCPSRWPPIRHRSARSTPPTCRWPCCT